MSSDHNGQAAQDAKAPARLEDFNDQTYLHVRGKLNLFFRFRNIADPENLADETIYRLVKKLAGEDGLWLVGDGVKMPEAITKVALGIAHNVYREHLKKKKEEPLTSEPRQAMAREQLLERKILLNEYLSRIRDDERKLWEEYHMDDREKLAKSRKMTLNALRLAVHRIRMQILKRSGELEGENRLA